MAEAPVRAAFRSYNDCNAGAGSVARLAGGFVAVVLGNVQLSVLSDFEHCVPGEQCGAHVRR